MKNTYKYCFLFLSLFLLLGVKGMAQETKDPIEEYLKLSAENNPGLKSIFNQYLATLERMPQAKALPDPTVMFNYFASPVETRVGAQRFGISLTQAFPWFGQLKSQEIAVAQLARMHYEEFVDAKNKLFYEVRVTYYDLYMLRAMIAITSENIRLLQSFSQLANVRYESAMGSAVDLLRVKIELEELQDQLLYLNDSQLPIQARFNELLNTASPLIIVVPDTLETIAFSENKNALLDSILTQNPLLKRFDYEDLSLDAEIDVARKMGLPSFTLGFSYINVSQRTDVSMPENGKDAFIFPQVGVRIPLYRMKYQAMLKEREILKTAVSNKKEEKENELTTAMEEGWRDYSEAVRRVALNQRLIRLANQALDILLAQYSTAGTNFEEVLRMDRQLLNYKLDLEKARVDQNTFVAKINYLAGKQF
jgi:cobalt-zinc-cadmium efflux system outer membrane protein